MQGKRQAALIDTLTALYSEDERERLRDLALANVRKWKEKAGAEEESLTVSVVANDWGVAVQEATQKYGEVFAALNMANANVFGGGYLEGMVAQEENMFRRTDCHFSHPTNLQASKETSVEDVVLKRVYYCKDETNLVNGDEGKVYLDMIPRICIKGPENKSDASLGYEKLEEEEIFPFYELRSAALDLRQPTNRSLSSEKQEEIMRRKISAQLETLADNHVRHVVLSAFGCGAFLNDANKIAQIYKEEIDRMSENFSVIVFAIYHAGYGTDNYTPFKKVLEPST